MYWKTIRKSLISFLILIFILIILEGFCSAANTLINNYLALGQLEQDDGMWVFMELYNNTLKPIVNILVVIVTVSTTIKILYNINKDIRKLRGEKNEKSN